MASEWIKHVLAVKKARGLSYKNALKEAKKTYKSSGHSMTHKKTHKKHHKKRRGKSHKVGKSCRMRR
jgi:hypothetical protein